MVLEAYSSIFSIIASSATIPLLLSPSLVCREFIKKGSADHIKPFTFVGGFSRCIIFVQYGILSGLSALVRVHTFGTILYTTYLILYYKHCTNKGPLLQLLFKAILLLSVLLGFANFRSESLITVHFGTIATIVHLGIIAAPLLNLRNVIRKKSTAGMPFPIIFCANIVSTSWLLYGISINNKTLMFQTTLTTIMTMTQLSLFLIYPSKEPQATKKKE